MRILLLAIVAAIAACSSDPEPANPPPLGQGGFSGSAPVVDTCDVDGDGFDARSCDGLDCDDAKAAVNPGATEACDNGVDDDCDGTTDEGCGCTPGDLLACWTGDAGKRGVGECRDGVQRCLPSGNWGPCSGQIDDTPEGDCDGLDQDCDGAVDLPECRSGVAGAVEICGNGLDDDQDGDIDNAGICTLSCAQVNPRGADPGALGCCLQDPPSPFSYTCYEYPGLPGCTERTCVDLDGDIATRCAKLCDAGGCVCGRRDGENILPSADCGFQTPCSRMDCDDRRDQPCYSGPPATLGVGICHAGKHSCEGDAGAKAWTACEGEQAPLLEVCENGVDDNCDGRIDEVDGASGKPCPLRTDCVTGAVELCGDGLDNDCDGFSDEACPAVGIAAQPCWTGPLLARGVGVCKDGRQPALDDDTWGACENQVLPSPEICGDGMDSDCNGLGGTGQREESSCCVPGTEVCNGLDDDCDGVADNGLLNRCGLCEGSCYGATIEDVGDCSAPGRTCEHVEPFALDPSLLTLSLQPPPEPSDVLYVVQSGQGGGFPPASLLQLDATTGGVNWSRTLLFSNFFVRVSASPDGSAWVVTGGQTPTLQHFDRDGNELCRVPVGVTSSTMLVDPGGDVWFTTGQQSGRTLRRYSATQVEPDTVPRCSIVDLRPDDAFNTDIPITGFDQMAFDANRRIWFTASSQQSNPGVAILDLVSAQVKTLSGFDGDSPALGADGVLYLGNPLRRVPAEVVYTGTSADVQAIGSYNNLGNLNAAPDGTIFGTASSGFTRQLLQVDPISGTTARSSDIPGSGQATGLTLDGYGKLWTATGNALVRFDPLSRTWDPLTIEGGGLVVMSTSSDRVARDLGRWQGSWSQVFDPGAYDVIWDQLDWSSYAPSGTRVIALVRFSDVPELLEDSTIVCGPFDSPPADISTCSDGRRYARVELLLSGYGAPVAGDVRLTWSRP